MSAARVGTSVDRFAYFTDAVMAIAMTMLVLEIPRPEGTTFAVDDQTSKAEAASHLWAFLTGQAASFFSYLLAFTTLWVVWRQHHRLADSIRWMTSATVGWHFPLLLLVGFLPYATTVVGHYPTNPGAALLYGVTLAGLLFCRSMVLSCAYQPSGVRRQVPASKLSDLACPAVWLGCRGGADGTDDRVGVLHGCDHPDLGRDRRHGVVAPKFDGF